MIKPMDYEIQFLPRVECCALGLPHVHKKKDGLLFRDGKGGGRFLTFRETLAYRIFGRLPDAKN